MHEEQRLRWQGERRGKRLHRIFVIALEAVGHEHAGQKQFLVPMAHHQEIEIGAEGAHARADLHLAAHDRADGADDAVAALDAQHVAMHLQNAQAEDPVFRLVGRRDADDDPLLAAIAQGAGEKLVDHPVGVLVLVALELGLLGEAAVVA